ncbi:hypothetical protein [Micromonospora sp. RTP1Z1]|uniref:hypothetical protein n=1 Tax=Micromonospora sp. RTP1Z1 TaxID=2994043 RepID=UPI0029C65A5A|nr:hypothetical protein [Micromonospora sp. RTP1Z1]
MASRNPRKLPACRHVEVGAQLQEARDRLVHLVVELSNAYPKSSGQVRAAERALRAVDELRSVLDDVSAGELPGEAWSTSIYYGGNVDVWRQEAERVLAMHQADNPPCCTG